MRFPWGQWLLSQPFTMAGLLTNLSVAVAVGIFGITAPLIPALVITLSVFGLWLIVLMKVRVIARARRDHDTAQ